ncbi:hypothetical protein DFH27DRAFT_569494 [Peziza echinospora]|nr:hypothetical protein DFH27DRAFT_569494 [Peziza echinospora]
MPAATTHPLFGEWVGQYGGHGPEKIRIDTHPELPRAICATKISGDPNVPANQVTWWANDVDENGRGKKFQGKGQIAETGYKNPSFVDATLEWFSDTSIQVTWAGFTIQFQRTSYPNGFLDNLLGEWVGNYAGHGQERIKIHIHPSIPRAICATKITGDANVPAGQITWWMNDSESGDNGTRTFRGKGQIAYTGFTNPSFVDASLQWFSNSSIEVTWIGYGAGIQFTRVSF